MPYSNSDLAEILSTVDLGSGVAEEDNLLETARVETSAFADLLHDRVDLVPGTKGSGKSALFRIFVDFIPQDLLDLNKVVVAHGVQKFTDSVFHAYKAQFQELSEDDFTSFWCIYLVSLANEQFIKGEMYQEHISDAGDETRAFLKACEKASIPNIEAKKSLREIIAWTLTVLKKWRPKIKIEPPGDVGAFTLDMFSSTTDAAGVDANLEPIPRYVEEIKTTLESVLTKSNLTIWLMIDRLDEIFPRRSEIERRALRGLLRAIRPFGSERIRVKVFCAMICSTRLSLAMKGSLLLRT